MNTVRVIEKSERKTVYEINGEDHTLGNLLEKILINDDRVSFASYENPHPLENKIVLTIVTKEGFKPEDVLRDALERIIEMSKDFGEKLKLALSEEGIEVEE